MNKFTFTKTKDPENKFDISNVTMEIEAENLRDILEHFEDFLKACGFHIKGYIGVKDE